VLEWYVQIQVVLVMQFQFYPFSQTDLVLRAMGVHRGLKEGSGYRERLGKRTSL
jgi:hypothetical protein